jgi:DNA-binding CsgD family transcriptional regulator
MGLHICKSIVEQFEGMIYVQSELGLGSTFVFSFKLSEIVDNESHNNRQVNPNIPRRRNYLIILKEEEKQYESSIAEDDSFTEISDSIDLSQNLISHYVPNDYVKIGTLNKRTIQRQLTFKNLNS